MVMYLTYSRVTDTIIAGVSPSNPELPPSQKEKWNNYLLLLIVSFENKDTCILYGSAHVLLEAKQGLEAMLIRDWVDESFLEIVSDYSCRFPWLGTLS